MRPRSIGGSPRPTISSSPRRCGSPLLPPRACRYNPFAGRLIARGFYVAAIRAEPFAVERVFRRHCLVAAAEHHAHLAADGFPRQRLKPERARHLLRSAALDPRLDSAGRARDDGLLARFVVLLGKIRGLFELLLGDAAL